MGYLPRWLLFFSLRQESWLVTDNKVGGKGEGDTYFAQFVRPLKQEQIHLVSPKSLNKVPELLTT